jgi:hypothetical protein
MNKFRDKWYAPINLVLALGIVAICLGIYYAFIAYFNFKEYNGEPNFRSIEFIEKFASVISSTSGVCFTLAGVMFLGYTLYQTRVEMSDTREILSTQLAESTLFKLMEHHRALVEKQNSPQNIFSERDSPGANTFKNELEKIKNRINRYGNCLTLHSFDSFNETRFTPNEQYKIFEKTKLIGGSLIHIINFISTKLKDEQKFYHNTLNFNITDDEKWLLGFIINHRVINLPTIPFDYTEHYMKNTEYTNPLSLEDELPILDVLPYSGKTFFLPAITHEYLTNSQKLITDISAIQFRNKSLSKVKIVKIEAAEVRYDADEQNPIVNVDYKIDSNKNDILTTESITMFGLFEHLILKELSVRNSIDIEIKFYFEYHNSNFTVKYFPFRMERFSHNIDGKSPVHEVGLRLAIKHNLKKVYSFSIRDIQSIRNEEEANKFRF